MRDIEVDTAHVPYEYEKKIKEGQKGGVVLVYINGKDEDEVLRKSRFVMKIVDNLREYADGLGAVLKMPKE